MFAKIVWILSIGLSAVSSGAPHEMEHRDPRPDSVLVLGSGVGGLTSALYLARAGLHPLVITGKNPGGLLTQSHSIQNWPGELEIDGLALTDRIKAQAEANGARFVDEEVVAVDFSQNPFRITTRPLDSEGPLTTRHAYAAIIAMGTQPNFLGVPGETGPDGYWGRGVTQCAVCDGNLYTGKRVGVVGGGDAAVLEASYLANLAKEVFLFVRKNRFRVSDESRLRQLLTKPNVKVFYQTCIERIEGDGEKLTQVILKSHKKRTFPFPLDGLFLAIGSTPNTAIFQKILSLDKKGYIRLTQGQKTDIPGIYAVGDIADPHYQQAISAAGDGAKAALQAQEFLSTERGPEVGL
jgi:thioredoxin reductase (NADPH)